LSSLRTGLIAQSCPFYRHISSIFQQGETPAKLAAATSILPAFTRPGLISVKTFLEKLMKT